MKRDENGNVIQCFGTTAIVAVTAGVAWTPDEKVSAFCVPEYCTYTINGEGESGTLNAHAARTVVNGFAYTFDTTMNIEVM